MDPTQASQQTVFQMNQQSGQKSPTQQMLNQLTQQCDQSKQQLTQQLAAIPNPQAQFAVQMAINALDNVTQQCVVAANAMVQAGA